MFDFTPYQAYYSVNWRQKWNDRVLKEQQMKEIEKKKKQLLLIKKT